MRYKTTSFAVAVLLIATPVFSQEASPIVVETPRTAKPTSVITGQPFTQTYIIRFIDLTDYGDEIVVQEDGLNPGMLGNFEVLGFRVQKTTIRKEFLEHRWYLTYTLRVINPEKGPYVIPPVTVPWILKRVGQDVSDPSLKVNTEFKTEPVHMNYVSTIPAKETSLDVRDGSDFGSFGRLPVFFRIASWLSVVLPFMMMVVWAVRRSRLKKTVSGPGVIVAEVEDNVEVSVLDVVSGGKALRGLRRHLKDFDKLEPGIAGKEELLELENRLSSSLNDFLRAELSMNVGATPAEMTVRINTLKDGRYKTSLLSLSKVAEDFYRDVQVDGEVSEGGFVRNIQFLRNTLRNMHWYYRLFLFTRRN